MPAVKERAIDLIKSLPDDCTLEDIQYHLYVVEKVQRGLAAVDAGRVMTRRQAHRKVGEWLKSSGQKRR